MKFPITTAACFALFHGFAAGNLYLYEGFGAYSAGQLAGQAISPLTVGLDTATPIIGGGTAAVNTLGAEGLEFTDLRVAGGRGLYSSATGAASYIGFRYNGPEVTGTLYSSFLVRIETAQNTASSVGLRVNTLNNSSGASSYFYTFAVSGNASAGTDFAPIASLVFQPGKDTVTLAVRPFTDDIAESDETVTLTLLEGAGYTPGDNRQATVTITDRRFGVDASRSRFMQKMDAGIPQKIVIYGTSLTAAGQWSAQMLGALQTIYPGLVTLVNSGGSGMESDWGVANLQTRVLDHNPDVVFIEFSVNDSVDRFNLTLARANANLLSMIDGIKAAGRIVRSSCK